MNNDLTKGTISTKNKDRVFIGARISVKANEKLEGLARNNFRSKSKELERIIMDAK